MFELVSVEMAWVDKRLVSRHRHHHDEVNRNKIGLIQFFFFYPAGSHSYFCYFCRIKKAKCTQNEREKEQKM